MKSNCQEVSDLKESNIEMVRLLSNPKHMKNFNGITSSYAVIENNLELNASQESISSVDTVIEGKLSPQRKEITKKRQHTNGYHRHKNVLNKTRNSARNSTKNTNVIVGNSQDAAAEFTASTSRLWLYVGRCKMDSKPENIKSYLENRSPGHSFEVTKLPSKGRNASYRVEADKELQDILYDPSYWPQGVIVKRFKFKFRSEFKPNEQPF